MLLRPQAETSAKQSVDPQDALLHAVRQSRPKWPLALALVSALASTQHQSQTLAQHLERKGERATSLAPAKTLVSLVTLTSVLQLLL